MVLNLSYEDIIDDIKENAKMDAKERKTISAGKRFSKEYNGVKYYDIFTMVRLPNGKILVETELYIGGYETFETIEQAKRSVRNYFGNGIKWSRIN